MSERPSPPGRRTTRGVGFLVAALGLWSPVGCAKNSDRDPLATALRYLSAAAAGDVETCYGLLGETAQSQCDRACLARILSRQRAEFRAARDELRSYIASGRSPTTQARYSALVRFRDGSELPLIQPETPSAPTGRRSPARLAYQIDGNPLSFYPQATPDQALRSFLLAVERKRWDVLVSFLPRALAAPASGVPYSADQIRARFEGPAQSDIARQLTALRQHLGEPLKLSPQGNEARLPVGENREARLLLEEGSWRIGQLE